MGFGGTLSSPTLDSCLAPISGLGPGPGPFTEPGRGCDDEEDGVCVEPGEGTRGEEGSCVLGFGLGFECEFGRGVSGGRRASSSAIASMLVGWSLRTERRSLFYRKL